MFKRPARARILPTGVDAFGLPKAGIADDATTKVGAGAYVLTKEWSELFSEGRLRTRAHAAARRRRTTNGAVSHATAAAMHSLPLYKVRHDRIDMTYPGVHPRRRGADVVRHHADLPEADVVEIDGLRVTSLERTVYDVIRTVSLEAAVVCFDAALRSIAWDDDTNVYDTAAAEDFRRRVQERIAAHSGARGIRQARFVAEFADGRAQLPGESISRLWMWQLGVPTPELQYRVDFPDGKYALLDFAWPQLARWAEFDGRIKLEDAELLAGRTPEEVIERQNRRERSIRAVTGWHCDHWGFEQMPTISDFAAFLRTIGLYPVLSPN